MDFAVIERIRRFWTCCRLLGTNRLSPGKRPNRTNRLVDQARPTAHDLSHVGCSVKKKNSERQNFQSELFNSVISTPFGPAANYLPNPFPRTSYLTSERQVTNISATHVATPPCAVMQNLAHSWPEVLQHSLVMVGPRPWVSLLYQPELTST